MDNNILHFRRETPRELTQYKIIGAKSFFASSNELGEFFYQEFLSSDYNFWFSCFRPARDFKLLTQHPTPWIGMRLVLKNHIQMAYGQKEFNIRQGQFNFGYLPIAESISFLKAGAEYIIFDLQPGNQLIRSIPYIYGNKTLHPSDSEEKPYFWAKAFQSNMELLENVEQFLKKPSNIILCQQVMDSITNLTTVPHLIPENLKDMQIAQMFEARNIMKIDLGKKYTIPKVAKMVNTNETYLTRHFHQVFGITPFNYIAERRDELTKWLLLHTDFDLNMIAKEIGILKSSSLIHSFKDRNLISPEEWRRSRKNK